MGQRHHLPMFKLDHLITLLIELLRALFVDVLSEGVRGLAERVRMRRSIRGMAAIRHHVHRRCRRRLFNRISTKHRKSRSS